MSDQYYREQAARRARKFWIVGGGLAAAACLVIAVGSLYYDACTGGFDRSVESVVRRYAQAVSRGELPAAQACWEKDAYYNLEAGCSEVCLQSVSGEGFEVLEVSLAEPVATPDGRSQLQAQVSVACPGDSGTQTGEILLDTAGRAYPWRHWLIVQSNLGGSVAEPWCK